MKMVTTLMVRFKVNLAIIRMAEIVELKIQNKVNKVLKVWVQKIKKKSCHNKTI